MERTRAHINSRSSRDYAKTKGGNHQSISALPVHIFIQILSRLSLKTLFSCMFVCKKWKELILDAKFAKLYRTKAPGCLILRSHRHGRRRSPRSLCLLDLEASDICSPDAVVKFSPDFGLPTGKFEVVNTCNGLICIRQFQPPNHISILNPLVGDYITLPPTKKKDKSCVFPWFGHSSKTDEYKVIQFVYWPFKLEVEIYTLGKGTWKSINEVTLSPPMRRHSAFVEECLHWIVDDPSKPEFIYCLDIGCEQFQSVPAPPHLGPNEKYRTEDMMLGVIGGCLYFFEYPLGDHFDIWVMKQYGVQESWTREFIIKNPSSEIIWYWNMYRPISLLSNGEILMSHKSKALVSYNPENRSFRFLKVYGMRNFEASPYVPGFLSLRDIVKGENIRVSNIHSR